MELTQARPRTLTASPTLWGDPAAGPFFAAVEHGTAAMYQRGCDCPPCMLASRDYMRQIRGTKPRELVTCWCEAENKRVPVEEIRAGQTRSCGRKGCHA